jgi:hypothetical protein
VKLPKLHQTTRLNHTVRARVAAPRCGELPDPTDPAEGRNAPAAVAPYLMANIASPPPSSPPPHLPRHSRTRHALAALLGSTGAWRSSESLSFFASGSTKRPLPEKSQKKVTPRRMTSLVQGGGGGGGSLWEAGREQSRGTMLCLRMSTPRLPCVICIRHQDVLHACNTYMHTPNTYTIHQHPPTHEHINIHETHAQIFFGLHSAHLRKRRRQKLPPQMCTYVCMYVYTHTHTHTHT